MASVISPEELWARLSGVCPPGRMQMTQADHVHKIMSDSLTIRSFAHDSLISS